MFVSAPGLYVAEEKINLGRKGWVGGIPGAWCFAKQMLSHARAR